MQQDDGGLGEKDGGEKMGSTEPDFVITREMPNQQSKNRVAYNYRTPTTQTFVLPEFTTKLSSRVDINDNQPN
jgi:hypothetical protein